MILRVFLFLFFVIQLSGASLEENLSQSNVDFAFSLFSQLGESENPVISPFSIDSSLYMTYFGSRGITELEMKDALQLKISQDALPETYRSLCSQLFNTSKTKDKSPFFFANAIWVDEKVTLSPLYQFIIQKNFQGSVEPINFSNQEVALSAINDWISSKTKGKIKNLLTEEDVSPSTRLLLTNALFLKASWEKPFPKKLTHSAPFYFRDHASMHIPMMHQVDDFAYSYNDYGQCLCLPFKSVQPSSLAFVIILPHEGLPNQIEQKSLFSLLKALEIKHIDLFLPSFQVEKRLDLNTILMQMGMIKPFSTSADFSGITGEKNLFLSQVVHGCFFSLNESGVEAAGASGAALNLKSIGTAQNAIRFEANRPFHYLIVDLQTNIVFFIGRFDKPEPIPVKKSFFSLS